MKLYSFFRSSASYRVRIALNLKGVAYDYVPVNLVRGGGEHNKAPYLAVNPAGRVPSLELDDGTVLTQSLAIIDYLEVTHPEPPIYPKNPVERAKAMAVALTVVAVIHPVNNVKVVNRIVNGRTSVTAAMALKLGSAFRTSPDFWLNAQRAVDLHQARALVRHLPRPLPAAS